MEIRDLVRLVERIGAAEAARRIGVTARTVARWARAGIPEGSRYAEAASQVVARHDRARKAASTRQANRRYAEKERAQGAPPEELRAGESSYLDDAAKLPTRDPHRDPSVSRDLRKTWDRAIELDADWCDGESVWVEVGRPVLDVSDTEVATHAQVLWEMSRRRTLILRFLFLRYVPFNPYYTGNMVAKQGHWIPWYASTHPIYDVWTIERYTRWRMDEAREAAQSRVIFFAAYEVRTYDRHDRGDEGGPGSVPPILGQTLYTTR